MKEKDKRVEAVKTLQQGEGEERQAGERDKTTPG
jgi:hypothetical protein